MAVDVLNSPALPFLLRLEAEGFEVATVDDRLLVKPIDRLPACVRSELSAYRRELVTLVRVCDGGVGGRREVFASQLARGVSVGRLALSADVPYVAGRCFSCGDALPRPVFGRCWRCALAWRLAVGTAVPPMVGEIYDRHRVVA